jgi:hypothetical protein
MALRSVAAPVSAGSGAIAMWWITAPSHTS